MACLLEEKLIRETIDFHGHNCPGLTIGIRVSELALSKLGLKKGDNAVCVTETDMCGVDAIQFITGCSLGKGNLVHRDFGKSAFTFFNREEKKGFRAVFRNDFKRDEQDRDERIKNLLEADLEDLFSIEAIEKDPARPAKVLRSIECGSCGEMTMESRIRLFGGSEYCIPCFKGVEQKI